MFVLPPKRSFFPDPPQRRSAGGSALPADRHPRLGPRDHHGAPWSGSSGFFFGGKAGGAGCFRRFFFLFFFIRLKSSFKILKYRVFCKTGTWLYKKILNLQKLLGVHTGVIASWCFGSPRSLTKGTLRPWFASEVRRTL